MHTPHSATVHLSMVTPAGTFLLASVSSDRHWLREVAPVPLGDAEVVVDVDDERFTYPVRVVAVDGDEVRTVSRGEMVRSVAPYPGSPTNSNS